MRISDWSSDVCSSDLSAEGEVWATTPHHDISFLCDDIEATIAELTAKGVTFTDEVRDMGYGLVTTFLVPAAGPMQLYQPRYQPPRSEERRVGKACVSTCRSR